MKAYIKNILLLLLFAATTVGVYAQTAPAEWRMYSKKQYGDSYAIFMGSEITSVKFTDTNYDLYVYTTDRGVKDDGRWYMKLTGYGELNIASIKLGIVPAEYSDELIESMYLNGSLTDLRESTDARTGFSTEFIVEDGVYKPVIFGYDAEGTYRGFSVGQEQIFTTSSVDYNELLIASVYGGGSAYDWGYGSLMHIRDVMGEEYVGTDNGYNWYRNWAANVSMGSGYAYQQVIWLTFDNAIKSLEKQIDMLEKRSQLVPINKASYGTALALRAMLYLDAARMYEFLDNDAVSSVNEAGNDVSGLTYPIGSSEVYRNDTTVRVKRATRSEMAAYILNDLDKAEQMLSGATADSKLMADLTVVYGLKARLYMWTENYAEARSCAEKAIASGQHTPLSQSEWLDTARGFNDCGVSSWMWAMTYPKDTELVQGGIVNWTSWCCNEYLNGYTGIGAYCMIGKSIYDRISDTDFRKLSFKAPYGSAFEGKEPHLPNSNYDYLPEYASLKFRPGQGEVDDGLIACAVDVPLMRIEEMYFIRCEADAQLGNLAAAKAELTAFMQYRDANYSVDVDDQQGIIDEIFLQKRIEFWGEGLNYFDYKRLNKPVTRQYDSTNFSQSFQFNTTTRPAWMNVVFVVNAYNGAIEDWNNPNPSNCYNISY